MKADKINGAVTRKQSEAADSIFNKIGDGGSGAQNRSTWFSGMAGVVFKTVAFW